jgi:hypothetical protein
MNSRGVRRIIMGKEEEDKKTGVAVAEASSSSSGTPGSSSARSVKTHIYFFEDDEAPSIWKVDPQTPKPQLYANPLHGLIINARCILF